MFRHQRATETEPIFIYADSRVSPIFVLHYYAVSQIMTNVKSLNGTNNIFVSIISRDTLIKTLQQVCNLDFSSPLRFRFSSPVAPIFKHFRFKGDFRQRKTGFEITASPAISHNAKGQ